MKQSIAKVLSVFLVCNAINSVAQIQVPQTPQFQNFDNSPVSNTNSHPYGGVITGATAQSINSQQQNAQALSLLQKQQEVAQLMRDVQASNNQYKQRTPQWTPADTSHMKGFEAALQYLKAMLAGKQPLSVADAYFAVETAYGKPYLTKTEFDKILNQSASFIKQWMQQNGLDLQENYMVHYAIKKFMSEPLTLKALKKDNDKRAKVESIVHQPFQYDYQDNGGEQDHRNIFFTKCLATGFGQCASMPIVYLALAEKLGVKAYLSLAPYHSFIKHPDNYGFMVNYEPTSNWEISDNWYKDNLFISARAIETGTFLDTFNSRQVVANCIYDLACEYIKVDRTGNDKFIYDCLRSADSYFPKKNNLSPFFIHGMCLKTNLLQAMKKYNITSFDDLDKAPEAKRLYERYLENEAGIAYLGWQDLPSGMYEEMLKQTEFKGKIQHNLQVDSKQKRDLFIKATP